MSQSRQTDNNAKVLKGTINAIISKIKKVRNIAIEKFPNIKGENYSGKLTQISSTISTNLEKLQNFLEELGTDENFELFLQSEGSNGKYFNDVLNYIFYGEKLKKNLADKIEFFIPGNKKGKIIALKNGTTEYTIPYLVKNVLSAQKQDVIDKNAAEQFIQSLKDELDAVKKERTTAKIRATKAENKNKKLQENLGIALAERDEANSEKNKSNAELNRNKKIAEIFEDAEREIAEASAVIKNIFDGWRNKTNLRNRAKNIATAMCDNIEVNLNALKNIVLDTNVELDENAVKNCINFILHGGKDEKGVENNEYTFGYTENGETKTRKFSNISEVVIKEGKTKKGKTKEGKTKQYTSTIENAKAEMMNRKKIGIVKHAILWSLVAVVATTIIGIIAGACSYNKGKNTTPEVGEANSPNNTSDRNGLIAQIYEMEDESEEYYTQQYGQKAKDVVDAMVGGANKVTIENVDLESGEASRVLNESLYNPDLVINQEIIDIANDEAKGVKELSTDQIKQLVEQTLTGSDEAFADGKDIVNEVIEYVKELIEGEIAADYDAVSVATMNLSNFKNASYYNCKPTAMSVWFTAEKNQQGVLQYILNGEIKFDSLNTSGNINGYVSTIKHIISKEAMVDIAKAINEESKKDEPKDISTVIYNNINELLGEIKADNTYERIKVDSNGIKEIRISVNDLNKAAKNSQGGGIDVPYKVVMEDGNIYEGAFTYDNCGKVVDTGIIKNNIIENCITGYGVESEAER